MTEIKVTDFVFKLTIGAVILVAATVSRGELLLFLAYIWRSQLDLKTLGQEETTLNAVLCQWRLENVYIYVCLSTISSFVMYICLAGGLHWYFYVKRKEEASEWKCQPEKFLTSENERHAIKMGSINMLIGSVVSGIIACYIINGGYTSLYYNISDRGWLYLLVSVPMQFLFNECAGYYSHRMFHIPYLYKSIHKWHHRYHQPSPFSATAMHPVEFLTYQSYLAAPVFLFPVHVAVYIGVLLYTYYYGVVDHSGIKMDALWPWQTSSMYHDNHHKYFHCNFGINTCLFDWLHDTIRHDNRIYGEDVFGGHGKIPANIKDKTS